MIPALSAVLASHRKHLYASFAPTSPKHQSPTAKTTHNRKNTKTPRTLNFINQFASGHQLVCQTQQSPNYNHKRIITIQ